MKLKLCFSALALIFLHFKANTQNLYSSNWSVGKEDIKDLSNLNSHELNVREIGKNHVGKDVVLWKIVTDSLNDSHSGIQGAFKQIDNTKTYRISVWLKKTTSNNNKLYFGCDSRIDNNKTTLNFDNSQDDESFFWYGDLPKANRWYLLVGYVHPENYKGEPLSNIYDGVTGEVINSDIKDFKFASNATNLALVTFFKNSSKEEDIHYVLEPSLEQINGNELSLNELLKVNPNSQLLFSYDEAGNQNQFFYCTEKGCKVPTPPDDKIVEPEDNNDVTESNIDLDLYPNPTKGTVSIKIPTNEESLVFTKTINVYDILGTLIQSIPADNTDSTKINMAYLSTGTYFIHVHISNGTSTTKQVIKH